MAKRKRQRMMSREQRAERRAAIEGEAETLGPVEVQRREDVALIEAHTQMPPLAWNALALAEWRGFVSEDADDDSPEFNAAVEREFERMTGVALTLESAQAAFDAEEDRVEAARERADMRRIR